MSSNRFFNQGDDRIAQAIDLGAESAAARVEAAQIDSGPQTEGLLRRSFRELSRVEHMGRTLNAVNGESSQSPGVSSCEGA